MPHPLVVYADFETLTTVTQGRIGQAEIRGCNDEVVSVAYAAVGTGYAVPERHRLAYDDGEDPAVWLLAQLLDLFKRYWDACRKPREIAWSEEEQRAHREATRCHICGQSFDAESKVVVDHDHFTGRYRGAAHSKCNLAWRNPKNLVCFFHNLTGFDGHLLIRAIRRVRLDPKLLEAFQAGLPEDFIDAPADPEDEPEPLEDGEELEPAERDMGWVGKCRFSILAKTSERYTVIRLGPLIFKDSARFLDASLRQLVDTLPADKFRYLAERHPHRAHLEHLMRKFKMPFKAMTSRAVLEGPPVLEPEAYADGCTPASCGCSGRRPRSWSSAPTATCCAATTCAMSCTWRMSSRPSARRCGSGAGWMPAGTRGSRALRGTQCCALPRPRWSSCTRATAAWIC